jgi:curli biogenesis system outer membrane secretion channel CsgG
VDNGLCRILISFFVLLFQMMRSDVWCRRVFWCVAPTIWVVALCSVTCAQVTTQKKRVAVLNFEDDSDGSAAASKVFGAEAGDVGKGISAQIIEKLIYGGKYTVIDRSAVKKLVEEQNSSEADRADAYSRAARIGRMLGLDAMIIGAITRFGPDAAQKEAGGGHSGMSTRKSKAYVDITARILDMTTGEVIVGFTATGESVRSGEVIRINGRGHPKKTQEVLGSEFVDSLLGEATRNAVEKIAGQLNSFAEKIPALRIEIDGLVAEVAGNSVTLNLGKKSGVRVGDKFAILREIRPVKDPQTGGFLPPVVEQVGEATVTEVADVYATAIFSGPGQVHVGDRVKSVADSQTPSHERAQHRE